MSDAKLVALKEALTACLGADPGEIDPNTNLIESGILDSLDTMKFLFELEKRTSNKIADDLVDEAIFTFNALSALIEL